jgi:hypothetical protein
MIQAPGTSTIKHYGFVTYSLHRKLVRYCVAMTFSITTISIIDLIATLSMTLGISTKCHYAECYVLFSVKLNVVMMSAMAPFFHTNGSDCQYKHTSLLGNLSVCVCVCVCVCVFVCFLVTNNWAKYLISLKILLKEKHASLLFKALSKE